MHTVPHIAEKPGEPGFSGFCALAEFTKNHYISIELYNGLANLLC
jgi:hypothetical protein